MQKHKAILPQDPLHYSSMGQPASTDHHSTTFIDDSGLIFLTVHYACGQPMLRPVRRIHATVDQLSGKSREVFSPNNCKHCVQRQKRALEARIEKHGGRL